MTRAESSGLDLAGREDGLELVRGHMIDCEELPCDSLVPHERETCLAMLSQQELWQTQPQDMWEADSSFTYCVVNTKGQT